MILFASTNNDTSLIRCTNNDANNDENNDANNDDNNDMNND